MSKVLVDRDLLVRLENAYMEGMSIYGECEEIRAILDKPAEAEGVEVVAYATPNEDGDWQLLFFDEKEAMLYVDEEPPAPLVLQSAHLAALSAVTAERDRLESTLIQTTTRHFAQQWKDRADDKKLDECLSEGIAMLEAERDQYRDMAGCMDLLRRDLIEAGIVGESCPPMFMTEGVLVYIAKLRAEAGGWIPLAESTPPDGVPVLRWPGWAAEISIDEWCNDHGCFLMSIEEGERATHWKPISAPAAMAAKEA